MNHAAQTIHLRWAHEKKIFGRKIGIAVLDTGICPIHPDFVGRRNRIVAFQDCVNGRTGVYDDNGHGTHVFGIAGADGTASSGFYTGVAPECDIIAVKVLNQRGNGNVEDVIKGLEWVTANKEKYNIRIVNISVGSTSKEPSGEDSELVHAVNEVWDRGIAVVVAAGNGGPNPQTIGSPGVSRKVITVGASDDDIAVDVFGSQTKNYSGRGPTCECIKKPDIVAPGSNIMSCNLIRRMGKINRPYISKSGTSMATPMVSGAICLLLSQYPQMSNREIKIRLKNSAVDLGESHEKQGWGMLHIERMLEFR